MTGTLSPRHTPPLDPNMSATDGPPGWWQFWHDWIEPSGAHYWVPALIVVMVALLLWRRRARQQKGRATDRAAR